MFTGLILAVGKIQRVETRGQDCRLYIDTTTLDMDAVALGDSIAVSGCCLTAVELGEHSFAADVSGETLAKTTVGQWQTGTRVNLEKSLTLSTPLGGHLVSGHVDGVGEVLRRWEDGRSHRFRLRAPDGLARYIAAKGSVAIDGISLTVNAVEGDEFEVNIIPHTLTHTTMSGYQAGSRFNLEVDLIARYAERLFSYSNEQQDKGISAEFLQKNGFIK